MTKRTVFFLALLAAGAAAPAPAQQFNTSSGAYSLRPLYSVSSELDLRLAASDAERALTALLADITTMEKALASAAQAVGGIAPKRQAEQAALDQAAAAFKELDTKYRADLAAFQQKQLELEAEVQRQRAEAEPLQQLPSAQRDHATIERLNRWAADLAARRDAFAGERDRLLQDHARVEAERTRIARMHAEAQARLTSLRDASVGSIGQADAKLVQAYAELRKVTLYLQQARGKLRTASRLEPSPSPVLEQANLRLRAFEAQRVKR